ncbi:putative oligomeric Golgi complex subunit 5 protein [Helianthus anomalus]
MAEPDVQKLDLSKAAQLHSEILRLCNENDLSGIGVIDEELNLVFEAGMRLRSEGMKALERGLEGFNQAEVGAGLQVFYNLESGCEECECCVGYEGDIWWRWWFWWSWWDTEKWYAAKWEWGKAKEALWQRMGSCMDQLHSVVVAIWHLQRVLSKKRDLFTHVLLLDEVMQILCTPSMRLEDRA